MKQEKEAPHSRRTLMTAPASQFLAAEWRNLAMLNYEVDAFILSPFVPAGVELDWWNGKTFVSVVGFQFLGTRVLGIPIPFHRNFDEVNLRFYVRRSSPEGMRRGVVFIKEIVPRAAIAWVARRVYNENYIALAMSHEIALSPGGASGAGRVAYNWRYRRCWNRLAVEVEGPARLADEQSEEAFITEHYWGYARQRDGSTLEYQVEHPRWNVWRASRAELDGNVAELYGSGFAQFLKRTPSSAFVADGSAVVVRKGVRLVSDGK